MNEQLQQQDESLLPKVDYEDPMFAKGPAPVPMTMPQVIQAVIASGADPAIVKQTMEIQERYEANESRKLFNTSMVHVQSDLPRVCSDARNPQTQSNYPTETRVRQTIQSQCLSQGFTTFVDESEPPQDDVVCVCLTIRHVSGHEMKMTRYGKVDMYGPKGNPNSTHVQGCQKTVTYLGRRMLLQAFGVVVDGDDNDGNGVAETITPKQVTNIENLVQESGRTIEHFLRVAKLNSVSDMTETQYQDFVQMLKKAGKQ